jgi:4'-phosphopantetheinyl transferase
MKKVLYYTNHASTKIIMHPFSPIHSYMLTDDIVHIWCIRLPINHQPLRFEKLQQLKLKRREILQDILKKYLHSQPILSETASGKPFITNHTLQFNMTHSGQLLMIALHASKPIGIDLEQLKRRDFIQFGTRFWGATFVQQHLGQHHPSLLPLTFFQAWTQTEAWVKQKGQTIFQFEDFTPKPQQTVLHQDLQLINFIPQIGYIGCICMPQSIHHTYLKYQDMSIP